MELVPVSLKVKCIYSNMKHFYQTNVENTVQLCQFTIHNNKRITDHLQPQIDL